MRRGRRRPGVGCRRAESAFIDEQHGEELLRGVGDAIPARTPCTGPAPADSCRPTDHRQLLIGHVQHGQYVGSVEVRHSKRSSLSARRNGSAPLGRSRLMSGWRSAELKPGVVGLSKRVALSGVAICKTATEPANALRA